MQIKQIIEEYKYQSEYVMSLNVTKEENVKALGLGYVFALLIVLIPVIIIAQFFAYPEYFNLVLAVLLVFATIFLSLGEIIHHKLLKKYSNDKRKTSLFLKHIIDSLVYLLMFTCSYVFVILIF